MIKQYTYTAYKKICLSALIIVSAVAWSHGQVYFMTSSSTPTTIKMANGSFAKEMYLRENQMHFAPVSVDSGSVYAYDLDLTQMLSSTYEFVAHFILPSADTTSISLSNTGIYGPDGTYLADASTSPTFNIRPTTINVTLDREFVFTQSFNLGDPVTFVLEVRQFDGDFTLYGREAIDVFFGPSIIFVDRSATGKNDGTSWLDAYTDMQSAIQELKTSYDKDSVLVAQGTYYPGVDRSSTFAINISCTILGGFPEGGSDYIVRNPFRYYTFFDGNIGDGTSVTDNVYSVISMKDFDFDEYITIDGLVIQNGMADGSAQLALGGGVDIHANYLYNPSVYFNNCIFKDNYGIKGGGIAIEHAYLDINNSQFYRNRSDFGGAIFMHDSHIEINNTAFQFNISKFGDFIFSDDRTYINSLTEP